MITVKLILMKLMSESAGGIINENVLSLTLIIISDNNYYILK